MPPIDQLTILVPVDISAEETPPLEIIDLLGPSQVVLLGYFPVPIQAEPTLIKDEYEAEAETRLRAIAEGRAELTEVLVFTHDREATVDRVAEQYDCDAVLTTGKIDAIDRILAPVRGDANLERIVSVVAGLLETTDATVTLFHAVADDADRSAAEFLLRGAVDRFVDYGVDERRVEQELSEGVDPAREILRLGADHDLVVLGETEPSLRERIRGDLLSHIVDELHRPALVVRDVQ